jgi:hypothetical protein
MFPVALRKALPRFTIAPCQLASLRARRVRRHGIEAWLRRCASIEAVHDVGVKETGWMSEGFRAVIAMRKIVVLAEDGFVFGRVEEESRE